MNRVIVKSVEATGNRLEVDFDCVGQVRKFFGGNRFFADYSISVENVPASVLVIPFLFTVCPIACMHAFEEE